MLLSLSDSPAAAMKHGQCNLATFDFFDQAEEAGRIWVQSKTSLRLCAGHHAWQLLLETNSHDSHIVAHPVRQCSGHLKCRWAGMKCEDLLSKGIISQDSKSRL